MILSSKDLYIFFYKTIKHKKWTLCVYFDLFAYCLLGEINFYQDFTTFPKKEETSNDIIAENGRFLKAYMFIIWLYLFKKHKSSVS